MESVLIGFNSNGDGLKSNSGLEGIQVVGSDVNVLGDLGDRGAGLARSILSSVRIRRFSAESSVLDDVLEGIIHQSSIASLVSVAAGAVNQLLFREGGELSGLEGDSSFNRSGGGERPARSALSLVLDGGHGVVLSPVNVVRDGDQSIHVQSDSGDGRVDSDGLESSLLGLEFSKGQVSEFVDSQSPGASFSVVLGDHVVVGLEDVVSVGILGSGVRLVVGNLELGEFLEVFLFRDTVSRSGEDGQEGKDESHVGVNKN